MNNGKVCVSVCAETADEMIAKIKRAEEFADVIEVRFDCLEASEVRKTVDHLPEIGTEYLFTFRANGSGGKRDISLTERLKFWDVIFQQHKSGLMIDMEANPAILKAITPNKITRILSLHNFRDASENLDDAFDLLTSQSNAAKIAVIANDISDSIGVWKLLLLSKNRNKEFVPIAMGEAGKWTRILGLAHGAFLTYASLEEGSETAPGQITANDMIDVYRVKELDQTTKVFGVVGDPVSESLSPYMHNAAFVEQNINAVFIPLQVKDLDEFIRRMVKTATREVELNFAGFSVTMPHKQAIIKYLDAIDPAAEKIGAVNTVKIDGDKMVGYNTDAYGFIVPLRERYGDLKDARVAVCGAGGAARACMYALKEQGAEITLFARDEEKAKVIADEFGVGFEQLSSDQQLLATDILVHATPLGMKGPLENESLFIAEQLKGVKFVYDLVTNSADTPIIREAKRVGVQAIGGIEMLIHQGATQFEIWTGQRAPIEKMKEAIVIKQK